MNPFHLLRKKADLSEEIESHLRMAIADRMARGESHSDARREAVREFGNVPLVEEVTRERWGWLRMEHLLQDLHFALRTLRRDRGFSVVVVLILAFGIGANITVFSVVDRILLRPLPFQDAKQLVWLEPGKNLDPRLRELAGLSAKTFGVDDVEAFQRQNRSFVSVTSYNPFFGNSEYTIKGNGEPQAVAGVMVAGNFFQTLGIQPKLGRLFTQDELVKGGRPAALLSEGFWRRQYHSDPGIVGQTILLNNKQVAVVGVMSGSFDFGAVFSPGMKFDVFVPAVMDEVRGWGNTLSMVGRLRPGVTLEQAQAESDIVFAAIKAANPGRPFDFSPTLSGLKNHVSGTLRQSMVLLWSMVGLVLLIVCANVSNLLVVRAAARGKEFAMRTALGAARGRLLLLLLTEGLVLSFTGASLGLGIAYALTTYLARQRSIALPLLNGIRVDATAILWTFGITLMTTLVFGLVPCMQLAERNLQGALKSSGHGMSGGGKHERLRSGMVIGEVALSCVLLVSGGLLLRSFLRTLNVDLGFDASRAAVMKIDYKQDGDGAARGRVLQEMLRGVLAVPGVKAAGVADMLPLGRNRHWQFWAKEHPPLKGELDLAIVRIVTPGYLAVMGMHLSQGRDFDWQDGEQKDGLNRVVIVNEAAARHFWPGVNALGRYGVVDGGDGGNAKVVGVISDVRQTSLETAAGPEIYLPVMQADPEGGELVVRSDLPTSTLPKSVLAALRAVNPGQPANELKPLEESVDHAVSPRRFFTVLVGSFAGLGLLLASLGIYGVISYSVGQRTHEIGIRMALGASRERVQQSVIFNTLRIAAIGIAVGTAASFIVARAISSVLFGTKPMDAVTFGGMTALLIIAALVAGYLPARRASRIDPMNAIRSN